MLFSEKVFAGAGGRGRVVHFVVAFFEGADGDVAVLPKPLIIEVLDFNDFFSPWAACIGPDAFLRYVEVLDFPDAASPHYSYGKAVLAGCGRPRH